MIIAKPEILLPLQESLSKGTLVTIRLRHHPDNLTTRVRSITNDIVHVDSTPIAGLSIARSSFYFAEIEEVKALKVLNNATLYLHLQLAKEHLARLQEKVSNAGRQLVGAN